MRNLLGLGGKRLAGRKSNNLFQRRLPGFAREFAWGFEVLEVRVLPAVTLGLGDIVFTGYQATAPDKSSFVLLKDVDSGTVLTVTDNAWNGSALGSTEGNSVITFGGNFSAGTQFNYDATRGSGLRWAVGSTTTNLTDTTGGNFALNASGDNLFAYNGSTAPTTGGAAIWVAAFATNAYVAAGSQTSSLTALPSAFTLGDTAFTLGLTNGASNENGAETAPATVSGTPSQIRATVNSAGNWTTFTTAGGQAIPPNITFTVTTGSNSAPTALDLSSTSIAENNAANATVGTFTTTDPDSGNTFTYSLVSGTGSADNGSFNISGSALRATNSLDFEAKNSYSIRVRTTDQGNLTFEQTFTITVTNVNEATNVLLNELKVNPPGSQATGDRYQYIELRGTAGTALTNVYLVMLDGNGSNVGTASYVIGLTGQSLGSNGLLMFKSPTAGHAAAAGTTVVTDTKFDSVSGGVLSKHTVSFYLATSTSPFVEGTDYDTNDNGVLDNLPAGFTVLDNVGWSDGDSGDVVYGGVSLTQSQGTPDAATRFTNNNATDATAWFNGDLYDVGNDPAQLLYDATRHSANLPLSPTVASLTPGDVNFTEPPEITTNSGLTVATGSTGNVITNADLEATDAEQTAAQLTYLVTVLPASGTLKFNNSAVVANVTTFTQADIAANKLKYDAPTSSSSTSFSFTVSDGIHSTSGSFTFTIQAATDTTLRIVDYNIASSGGTGDPRTGFNTLLQAFSQESYNGIVAQVDLFVFQEVKSQNTTSQFIVNALNGVYGSGVYDHGTLDGYTSGAGTQGVVYNTQTLQLVSETTVGAASGASRQTLRYLFHPIGGLATSDFYVYNSHLKASQGSAEEAQRLAEVQVIRDNADALGQGVNIIYAGDFNLYTSSESAYQEFLGAGNGQASDPLGRPGNWHNNSSFVSILTQAPAVSPPAGLTSGGLDDRFDFQLISGELTDGNGLEYLTGSYHTFGNNGSVALNDDINDSSSTALPGLANRTTVLDLLTTVTDHLPVVADYSFTVSAANTAPTAVAFVNSTTSIAENTVIGTDLKVADISVTDDGLGTNTLSLSGTDQAFFKITGTSLYLKAGTSLNFEAKASYAVTVNVDDTTVGSTPDASASFTLNVTNVNEAPTAVAFANTTSSLAENTVIGTGLKVADINVTDDALGTNTLSLSGADQAIFKLIGAALYLKAGANLDFEAQSTYFVTVNVDDATVGSTPDASASFTLNITNVNEAPTALAFANSTTSVAENTVIGADLKVADINVTDDALGTNTLSLSGADQAVFKLIGTALYLKAGANLDFEAQSAYFVTVNVDDATVGSTPDASASFTLNITNVNEAPTALAFANSTTSVAENTVTGTDLKVADINLTDDALGTNTLSLSGVDQAVFKLIGTALYLKAGVSLDFESQSAYFVTVNVDDSTVGSTPDASASFTLNVTNVNEAPTALAFANSTTSIAENTSIGADLKVADINLTDDALGTNTLSLSGVDQAVIKLVGTALYLKAGANLDFESQSAYFVTVNVDDSTVGSTPDASASFTLNVTNVNEAPTAVAFANTTSSLAENTLIGADMKVADINVTDDALGINTLSLSGAEQAFFKLIGTGLYLKAGTSLNFESQSTYAVTVNVDDSTVGGTPDASSSFTLNITNVNEAPTALAFANSTTSVVENTVIGTDLKVADINVTDDALGINTLSLSGAEQAFFKLIDTGLYLKAGTSLNFEAQSTYAVTVNVDDTTIGSTPDASASFTLNVTNVNEAPTALAFVNTTTSIAENTSIGADLKVADVNLTDDALGTNTLSLSGADQAAFKLIGTALYLKAGANLDFEAQSSYSVTVNVDDTTVGSTPDASSSFTLNITNVNEAPTVNASQTFSVAENSAGGIVAGTLTGSDPDAGQTSTLTFAKTGNGTGAALFDVAANGQITVDAGAVLDFEMTPSYTLEVMATDTGSPGLSSAAVMVTINLVDVAETSNQVPTAVSFTNTTTSLAENAAIGSDLKVADINVADDAQGTNTLSLSGPGQAVFKIIGTSLYLKAGTSLNFELQPSYSVTVSVDDATVGGTPDASASFTLTVNNLDEVAPTITSGATATAISENSGAGQVVYSATATDTGDISAAPITFSLGGTDAGAFSINAGTGEVTLTANPDFEAKSSYSFTIVASDAAGNVSAAKTVTLAIINLDEVAPTITSGATATAITENSGAGQAVYTATAVDSGDVSAKPITFSLGGTDAGAFSINSSSGAVTLTANPNFEVKSSYSFTVTAADAAGNASAAKTVTLAITNLDEVAPAITSSASATTINENSGPGQVIYTATATDTGDISATPITFSLGGTDAGAFSINSSSGAVTLTANPNFESKSNYIFTVTATDAAGNASAAKTVTLAITNVDEVAPTIMSGATATTINENSGSGQVVYTATATDTGDISAAPITFSLGGTDAGAFSINSSSGTVTLTANPNFEAKPTYSFTVTATDAAGNASAAKTVTLGINNLDEVAPTITSSASATTITENSGAGQVVYATTATDTGDIAAAPITFSLGGTDAGAFGINATTGAVALTANPNFEFKSNYIFTVTATDAAGNASAAKTVTLTINNLDEVAPTITSGATATAITENSGASQVVYTATATDSADISAAPITFSLGGTDAGSFSINATTGAVTLTANPDFEAKSSYSFTVTATDAADNVSNAKIVTLAITNLDEVAPTITSGATATAITENSGAGQAVYIATATDTGDVAAAPITFSLGGTDAGAFSINGSSGAVTLTADPNFEAQSNYIFTVVATDAAGNTSAAKTVTLAITDLNEHPPAFTSAANFHVVENLSTIGTVSAIDADVPAQVLTFRITGGADAGLILISANGVLTFNVAPDYEIPADSDGDHVYEFQITVDDGAGLSTTQAISVTVTDENETPQLLLGGSAVTWIKKHPAVTVLPELTVGTSTTPAGGTLTIQMPASGTRKKSRDQLTSSETSTLGASTGVQYTNGQLTLEIDLGPNVTGEAVQSFLRGIKFRTKGAGLKLASRTVNVTLSNSDGLSSSVSQTIHVQRKA